MVFSSPVFLFIFLPITILLYFALPHFLKNIFLFAASVIFYAWGEVQYFYLMLISILVNYFLAQSLRRSSGPISKWLLSGGIILNLLPLIYFKYSNFIRETIGLEIDKSITLPLGISFFTFHALSYIIDVYKNKSAPQRSFVNLGLYITNFPQLVAGPIVRYPEIEDQLQNHKTNSENFATGIKRFIIGLSKKVLIANTVAVVADAVFKSSTGELNTYYAWVGIICYTIQIYFDFSGYSDMAVGLGKMFGFNFPENFNYPYIARSIKDFWRRWHISLSNWFRDYVYIPLGGSHHGPFKTYFNLITIFFLCGLWHGAGWTFILWGLWHGCFLVLERTSFGKLVEKLPLAFQHIYTILIVIIGWIFFRSDSPSYAIDYIQILFGFKNFTTSFSLSYFPDTDIILALVAGVIGSSPIVDTVVQKIFKNRSLNFDLLNTSVILVLFLLSIMALASGTYNPFIYFRF